MRRKELSERIERHMERGEELAELNRTAFARNTEAFERNREAVERVIAVLDRHEQMYEENKLFIREMTRRSERVVQDLVQGNQKFLDRLSAQFEEGREEARQDRKEAREDRKEAREESKAQTQALLRLIDRLPPPAQAA